MNRTLIIEDVPELQTLLLLVLKSQNFTCDVASSREQADNLLKNLPQLVILDLDFDFFNGVGKKLHKELRSNDAYRDIPVLVLSTNSKTLAMYKTLYNAVTVDKPFDLATITAKIKSLLDKAAAPSCVTLA